MALLWVWHVRTRNAGIVDAGWAALAGGLAVFDAAAAPAATAPTRGSSGSCRCRAAKAVLFFAAGVRLRGQSRARARRCDLTNYSTLAQYPLAITLVDIGWGMFATAACSTIVRAFE